MTFDMYERYIDMKTFDGLGLNPILAHQLERMEYTTPTPIQAQAIPFALEGRDIMGSAQTGTGKTAAFAIPLIEHLLGDDKNAAIVLSPTRELAKQIMEVMKQMLGPKANVKTAFLIGGEPMHKQNRQLQQRPRLVVGTPGRINDHLKRRNLDLNMTNFLVLDETDRMLDMGFSVQIDDIVKHLHEQRQTLMFSATLPKNIVDLSQNYLTNPERVSVGSTNNAHKNIKQTIVRVNDDAKYEELTRELDERTGSVVMFVKTKRACDRIAKRLNADGHHADAIHGDLNQRKRDRVIKNYRAKEFRILVATDVASRGLDIPHIEHVINYDMPQVPEDYIHRIGRTARAGAQGEALCFVSPADGRKWHAIQMLMNPEIKQEGQRENRNGKRKRSQGKYQGKPQGKYGKKPQGNKYGKPSSGRPSRDRDDKPSYSKKKTYGKKPNSNGNGNRDGNSNRDEQQQSRGDKPAYGRKSSGNNEEQRSYGKKKSYGGDSGKPTGKRNSQKSYGKKKSYGGGSGGGGSKPNGRNYQGGRPQGGGKTHFSGKKAA